MKLCKNSIRINVGEVNEMLHEPMRLFIVKFIAEMRGRVDFNTLLKATELSEDEL